MSGAFRLLLTGAVVTVAIGLSALAWADLTERNPRPSGPALVSSAGDISIGNSRQGKAVFSARNLLPGQSRSGSVKISNPNRQPMNLSLDSRLSSGVPLAGSLDLRVSRQGDSLYAGRLAGLQRLPLGEMAPGESREYQFEVAMPGGSGNALQGQSGAVDLIWSARAAGPPPQCRLRDMRARFFVFRGRSRIRLVSRYKAAVPARVAIDFYERRRNGEPGRRVGTLRTRFARRPHRWGRSRVARTRGPAEIRRFRESKRGYVAQLRVSGAPGYCRQYLNLDLVQLKRFYGQYVWFQRGSFRTR